MLRSIFVAVLILASAHASAFTVVMNAKAEGGDKPTIVGTTNLPDGSYLMITVSRKESKFIVQDKVTVNGGTFRAGPFSGGGAALNPSTYSVEIATPLPSLQPPPTWPIIGNDGENMQGPLVKKSKYGGKIVEYATTFKVGAGKPSAEKDSAARTQSDKDMHEWWLNNCKSNCNFVQSNARQRGDSYDWDRCYYKCVADEPKKK